MTPPRRALALVTGAALTHACFSSSIWLAVPAVAVAACIGDLPSEVGVVPGAAGAPAAGGASGGAAGASGTGGAGAASTGGGTGGTTSGSGGTAGGGGASGGTGGSAGGAGDAGSAGAGGGSAGAGGTSPVPCTHPTGASFACFDASITAPQAVVCPLYPRGTPCGVGDHLGGACDAAGACLARPSCGGTAAMNCAAPVGAGMSSVDCCDATMVGQGIFDAQFAGATTCSGMKSPVVVSPFVIDRYEVTVARFARFVQAYDSSAKQPACGAGGDALFETPTVGSPQAELGGWRPEWSSAMPTTSAELIAAVSHGDAKQACSLATWPAAWDSVASIGDPCPTGTANCPGKLPINCVSWEIAQAFCIWDGGRLATSLEWLYAASNGAKQCSMPWCPPAPPADGSSAEAVWGPNVAAVGAGSDVAYTDFTPLVGGVATLPIFDLAGNLTEWVSSDQESLPTWSPLSNGKIGGGACVNCNSVSPAADAGSVWMGGGFSQSGSSQWFRRNDDPNIAGGDPRHYYEQLAGIRCVRPAPKDYAARYVAALPTASYCAGQGGGGGSGGAVEPPGDCASYAAAPAVTGLAPMMAKVFQPTTFTVTGTDMPSTLQLYVPNCTVSTATMGTATSRTLTCTPMFAGAFTALVKDDVGGKVLAMFSVVFS